MLLIVILCGHLSLVHDIFIHSEELQIFAKFKIKLLHIENRSIDEKFIDQVLIGYLC